MILRFGRLRISPKHIIICILYITMFMGILTDMLGVPSIIRFFNDALVAVLFLCILYQRRFFQRICVSRVNGIFVAMLIYTVVNCMTIAINFVPANLVIWAIRNTYRFFVFYWACVLFLDRQDLEHIFEMLYRIQWINTLLVFYQYFVLDLKQDVLGGIFGYGANAGLLIYSIILLTYAVTNFIAGKYSLFRTVFVLVTTSISSVLAELRVFFVILAVIVAVNMLLNKGTLRKTAILLGFMGLFFVAMAIYSVVYPELQLSLAGLIMEAKSTGGDYNISRLGAFSEINKIFFKNGIVENLFGYGFGMCEHSSLSLFTSDFYRAYGSYNYRWFAHQWIFLETGYAGVVSYLAIMVAGCIHSLKGLFTKEDNDRTLFLFCLIMGVCCIISFMYNSLLKADFAYLAFFSLSVSGIVKSNKCGHE